VGKVGKYKVSVVTAVYNVEEYLQEMIESITVQTIGFANVQLILIDDGSQDSSGQICDQYALQYPENIIVIHKENGGVSSARNEGLRYVKGEYINFTDADDMLENNALELMFAYLKKNEEKIDLVAIPLKLLGGGYAEHALNYKFKNTKIVDLEKEYNFTQSTISSTLIKKECLANRQFDTDLSYAEDGQMALDILLDKMQYGVVCETNYLYRKRNTKSSAVDMGRNRESYYIPVMEKFILYSLKRAIVKKGYIPQFVQYSCMYELQWRLGVNRLVEIDVLKNEEIQKYKELILKALQYIENNIIIEQKNLLSNYKTAILLLKQENIEKKRIEFYTDDIRICIGDSYKSAGTSAYESKYEFITFLADEIIIEGYVRYFSELDNIEVILKSQENDTSVEFYAEIFDMEDHYSFCMDKVITKAKGFRFSLKRNELLEKIGLQLSIQYKEINIVCKNVCFGDKFPLSKQIKSSYVYENGILLTYADNMLEILQIKDEKDANEYERTFQQEILTEKNDVSESELALRTEYFNLKQNKKNEIWLICDEEIKAGGNGEKVFSYINTVGKVENLEVYFIISTESEDYMRLCAIGKVVPLGSRRHKILALLCNKIISSQEGNFIFNCFNDKLYLYKDIVYCQKFITLSNDIIQGNISEWCKKIMDL